MSRKHYIEVAEMLHSMNVNPEHCDSCAAKHERTEVIARELAGIFKRDNPRFDRDRFYRAAGFPELADN